MRPITDPTCSGLKKKMIEIGGPEELKKGEVRQPDSNLSHSLTLESDQRAYDRYCCCSAGSARTALNFVTTTGVPLSDRVESPLSLDRQPKINDLRRP